MKVIPYNIKTYFSVPIFQVCFSDTPTHTHTHTYTTTPSFIQQICDSLDSVLGARDRTMNKIDEDLAFMNLIF